MSILKLEGVFVLFKETSGEVNVISPIINNKFENYNCCVQTMLLIRSIYRNPWKTKTG